MRLILKIFLAMASVVVGWLPQVCILVLAGAYLFQIYSFILSPGMAVTLKYATPDGDSRVNIGAYSLDIENRRLTLLDVSLTDAKGKTAARVNKAEGRLEGPAFVVRADDVWLSLDRLPTGGLDLNSILPKTPQNAGEFGLSVSIKRAEVQYRDPVVNKNISVLGELLVFEQGDTDSLFTGRVSLSGSAPLDVVAHSAKDGNLKLLVNTDKFEAAPWVPLLESWLPEQAKAGWKGSTAKSLLVSGQFTMLMADQVFPDLYSRLSFKGDQITVPKVIEAWTGDGNLVYDEGFVQAEAKVRRPGASIAFKGGAVTYPLKAGGEYDLTSSGRSNLWKEIAWLVPKEADFRNGRLKGVIRTASTTDVEGEIQADALRFGADKIDLAKGQLTYRGDRLTAKILQGTTLQRPVSGWVDWVTKTDQIAAWVSSPTGPLGPAMARAGQSGLDADGEVEAALMGTSKMPLLHARTSLSGNYQWDPKQRPVRVTVGEVRLVAGRKGAQVSRATAVTPSGIASVSGEFDWKGGMNLDVEGSSLRLGSFVEDAEGLGFVQGRLTGSFTKPVFEGLAEGYGLKLQGREAAWLRGGINFDGKTLRAANLRGQAGSGLFAGFLDWEMGSNKINGALNAKNLFYADWIPAEVVGTFDLSDGYISGTTAEPLLTARLNGGRLLGFGVRADSLESQLQADRLGVRLSSLKAQVGQGSIAGDIAFLLQGGQLTGDLNAESIPLNRLPLPADVALVGGTTSGKVTLSGTEKDGYKGSAEATLKDLSVNATPIGSGQATVNFAGDKLSATAEVGSLERFVALRRLDIDLKGQTIEADADVLNFEISTLVKALQESWQDQPVRVQEAIRSTEGLVTGVAKVSGSLNDPDFSLDNSSIGFLEVYGRPAGAMTFSGGKKGSIWSLGALEWKSDDMVLKTDRASYDPKVGFDLLLSLSNFDLTWLSRTSPDFPSLSGKASVTLVGSGKPDDINLQASLFAEEGRFVGQQGESLSIFESLNFDSISLEKGVVQASGIGRLKGFQGAIQARVPLSVFESTGTETADVKINLNRRPISDFREYSASLKDLPLEGFAEGNASLTGRAGSWLTAVNLKAEGTRLGLPGATTEIRDFNLNLSLLDKAASAKGSFAGSRGGRVEFTDLRALLPNLFDDSTSLSDILEESQLSGSVLVKDLALAEPLAANTQPSRATLNGEIVLGGSLARAVIGGGLKATGGEVILPSAFGEGGVAGVLPYEPVFSSFGLDVGAGTPIRFGLGRLDVGGSGMMSGALSALNLRLPLAVSRGQLRLPNARINLQPGGRVDVGFRGDAGLALQVNVDLEGQTNVTARRGADQFENYEVLLDFQGDLLNPDGLRITATSDPGDLTSQEILAILGQRELVEALAASALQGKGAYSLRDPLYQIALPSLADPVTSKIAQALKLDYLSLDYNPFDQAITRFGKTLGGGVTIQGWRQLSEPQFGPAKYDLRISYRLPLSAKFLDRVRIGFGTTHDRPWRFTVDWGRRW